MVNDYSYFLISLKSLNLLRRRHMELFISAPFGYVIFNDEGVIKVHNKAFHFMIGHGFEMESAPIYKWIHPESQDAFCFHIRTLMLKKQRQILLLNRTTG